MLGEIEARNSIREFTTHKLNTIRKYSKFAQDEMNFYITALDKIGDDFELLELYQKFYASYVDYVSNTEALRPLLEAEWCTVVDLQIGQCQRILHYAIGNRLLRNARQFLSKCTDREIIAHYGTYENILDLISERNQIIYELRDKYKIADF